MFSKNKQIAINTGYWKVTLFNPDADYNLSYDPGYIQFEHEDFPQTIKKQNTWFKGQGPYRIEGYKPPTLLSVWKMLHERINCRHFTFESWVVTREYECLKYQLMEMVGDFDSNTIHENIIGDDLSGQTHFIDFLEMLKSIELDIINRRDLKLIDYQKAKDARDSVLKTMIKKLDSAL